MARKPTIFFNGTSWSYRYHLLDENLNKKYRVRGGFQSQEAAADAYHKHLKMINKDEQGLTLAGRNTTLFSDYLQQWFESKESWKHITRMVYECVMKLILPKLGKACLGTMNAEYIKAHIAWISRQNKSYGEKLYELFSMALGDAFRSGKISYNPMENVKKPIRKQVQIVRLTNEGRKLLFQAIKNSRWCLELSLGLLCGLRKGEILELKFSDFSMENKTIRIQRYTVDEPSSNTERTISVPPFILKELEKRKAKIEFEKSICKKEYRDNGYISCQRDGKRRGTSSLNTELTKLCERIGLSHLSVDDLRDIYADMILRKEKGTFMALQYLMGYCTVEEVYERYCDLEEENTNIVGAINQAYAMD